MNPKQTLPLIAALAQGATVAPPIIIGAAIGLGLVWLFSDSSKSEPSAIEGATPLASPEEPVTVQSPRTPPKNAKRTPRITREDVAAALDYGARPVGRSEAVAALQELGFRKTAAYRALSPGSRLADFMVVSADGMIEWNG